MGEKYDCEKFESVQEVYSCPPTEGRVHDSPTIIAKLHDNKLRSRN